MKNETGRSMIEMLGVLAIIGVLSVGGIAGYSKAMMQIKINKTIGQITEAYTNVRTLCRDRSCIGGGDGPMMTIVYPEDLTGCAERDFGDYIMYEGCNHALGGRFDMSSYAMIPDKDSFIITIEGLKDKEACVKLATYDWNFSDLHFIGLGTDGGGFIYGECQPASLTKDSENYVEGEGEYIVKCDKITPAEAAYFCSNCSEDGCGISLSYYY